MTARFGYAAACITELLPYLGLLDLVHILVDQLSISTKKTSEIRSFSNSPPTGENDALTGRAHGHGRNLCGGSPERLVVFAIGWVQTFNQIVESLDRIV